MLRLFFLFSSNSFYLKRSTVNNEYKHKKRYVKSMETLKYFLESGKLLGLTFDTNCECGRSSADTIGGPHFISTRVLSHCLQDVQGTEPKVVHGPERQNKWSVNKRLHKQVLSTKWTSYQGNSGTFNIKLTNIISRYKNWSIFIVFMTYLNLWPIWRALPLWNHSTFMVGSG